MDSYPQIAHTWVSRYYICIVGWMIDIQKSTMCILRFSLIQNMPSINSLYVGVCTTIKHFYKIHRGKLSGMIHLCSHHKHKFLQPLILAGFVIIIKYFNACYVRIDKISHFSLSLIFGHYEFGFLFCELSICICFFCYLY